MANLIDTWVEIYLKQKYKIQEAADRIRAIKEKLDNKAVVIDNHLIYIYLWQDSSNNMAKWKSEIRNAMYQLPLIKGKNKVPTREQLYKWYFTTKLENIQRGIVGMVDNACYTENQDVPSYNQEKIMCYIQDYYRWLCERLSDGNVISLREVSDEIDSLLNKYL